jgi:UDPglucose--hexose-1-phosphate uridylyltransferase
MQAAREYWEVNDGACLHCDVLTQEHEDGRRVVAKGEHFTAFIPFYAHFPFEAHVYARRCAPSIADLGAEERRDLASVLERLLAGYDSLFGFSLPYMMVMHQAPTDGEGHTGIAHFHIEFYPPNRTGDKLKYQAGSETGAGAFIMDVLPEDSAATLRAKVESS